MINEIIKVNSAYSERVASYIQKKEVYIKPNFHPIYIENLNEWKINQVLSKTETVYLHSLLIVKDLIKKSLTENVDYSNYAFQIIENWWEKNQNNEIAWNEHAVAERTLNLIYFQENSSKKIKFKKYEKILRMHLEFLFNSKNYKNNNHGLMMDRSLLVGSYYSNNFTYRERAIDRFNVFVYRDFSRAGIHLENSPEYHTLALKLVLEFTLVLEKMGIEINNDLKNIIRKAELYIPRISRPDKTIPLLGDSGDKKMLAEKLYGHINDHTSGVFLYQDIKPKNWLLSSNGYQNNTHKHKDDMSIQFSINKLNIITDSGKFNYDSASEIRKYIISDAAHSKPYILERNYRFDAKERLKTNIILNTDDLYHIEMSYFKPRDFHILRNVVLHKESSSLFIIDRFSSKEQLNYISNYVLNPEMIFNINNNEINFKNTNYIFSSNKNIKIISSNEEKNNWYSSKFNSYKKTNRLILTTKGHNCTHIAYMKSNDIQIEVRLNNGNIELKVDNHEYIINKTEIEKF